MVLGLIVLVGALLRFWALGSTELIHDEGLDAFRSIGYLDYFDSAAQSTPIQWLADKPLPWWTSLSFHDDPPLFFVLQHVSFLMFGETLFAARLPSALAGVGSIIVMFFIVRRLARFSRAAENDIAALVASFLLSVNFAHIWVSRIAILDSTAFFWVLCNIYFFLIFLENPRRWFWFGATLGLAFLTKYTSILVLPVYGVYLLWERPTLIRQRQLYCALLVALILFSPVIIYNISLYQTFGHFDLQLATLLHQKVSYWQGESGKTQEPFANIIENMLAMYSLPFLLLAVLSLGVLRIKRKMFPVLLFVFTTLFLVAIGSALRFIVLYAMSSVMAIGIFASSLWVWAVSRKEQWIKFVTGGCFVAFLLYESFFAIHTARVVYAADFGVNQLNHYFDAAFGNARPQGTPQHPNPHLNEVIARFASRYPNTLGLTGIIYDENIILPDTLWLFSRRQYYHGMPITTASAFQEMVQKNNIDSIKGFTFYFVKADNGAPLNPVAHSLAADRIEQLLKEKLKLSPDTTILDESGTPAFRVYKFSLIL